MVLLDLGMAGSGKKRKDLRVSASLTAADVMAREVKTVPQSMRVKDLIQSLAHRKVSGVPAVDEYGKLAGVISETDIVRAQAHLTGKDFYYTFYEYDPFAGQVGLFGECIPKVLDMQVADLMTREVIMALPQESLPIVIRRMLAHGIHRLIVAEEKVILGLISTLDIMQALALGRISLTEPPTKVADLSLEVTPVASEDMLIRELIDILAEMGITGLPVIREDGTVLGVVSQADLVRQEAESDRRRYKFPDFYGLDPFMKKVPLVRDFGQEVLERPVKEFMNPRVISVTLETPITAVAKTMVAEQIHRLLVMDREGRLKGVISTLEVIKALA
jgi:CBS domain-containing protein